MNKHLVTACVFVAWCLLGAFPLLWAQGKVDINTGSVAELDTLPGIGPAIAARIVEFRSRNGPFRRPEDLMNVRGIGEKKFLKLKERIAISGTGPAARNPAPAPAKATSAPKPKRQ
ncbi:MAG: helix-hairpin-helix domain-containing protein [Acidobacteria bacterium]|nr:MAG: helix-hairpin-helix domain-containing protein [Acidobacteriota bacterium]